MSDYVLYLTIIYRLDLNCVVGSKSLVDLVVRGDRFGRRVKAFSCQSTADLRGVSFPASGPFQLAPGAYNRVSLNYKPTSAGSRRIQVNIVDVDTRELITAWLLIVNVSAPVVMRKYDVDVRAGGGGHDHDGVSVSVSASVLKKFAFQNPWDLPRTFSLVSSDETVMRPKDEQLVVAPHGNAYIRLAFSALRHDDVTANEVYLFLNDESGQSEECYLFHIFAGRGAGSNN